MAVAALSAQADAAGAVASIAATARAARLGEAEPAGEPAQSITDASVLADAIVRAAKGVGAVADDPTGARVISARLDRVIFRIEKPPGLRFAGKALVVGYDPERDVEGRPSSARIARFLEESL